MTKRKHYTSEERTKILRDLIDNNQTISAVSEKYGVNPMNIFRWKKDLFESASDNQSTSRKQSDKRLSEAERRIAELESLLAKREGLIAELVEDNIALKKKAIGERLVRNGSNRK